MQPEVNSENSANKDGPNTKHTATYDFLRLMTPMYIRPGGWSHNRAMRVIAGTYRSRKLTAPAGEKTRPTSDRLRETLFNVVAAQVDDSVWIDLFAGSGAVGIEALSRGARMVHLVESSSRAVQAIRSNLASLKISQG